MTLHSASSFGIRAFQPADITQLKAAHYHKFMQYYWLSLRSSNQAQLMKCGKRERPFGDRGDVHVPGCIQQPPKHRCCMHRGGHPAPPRFWAQVGEHACEKLLCVACQQFSQLGLVGLHSSSSVKAQRHSIPECGCLLVSAVIPCIAFVALTGFGTLNPPADEHEAEHRWMRRGMPDRDMIGSYAATAVMNAFYRFTWYWGFNVLSWGTLGHFQFAGAVCCLPFMPCHLSSYLCRLLLISNAMTMHTPLSSSGISDPESFIFALNADVLAALMPWHLMFRFLQLADMPQVKNKAGWLLGAAHLLMILDILKTMWVPNHVHVP